MKLKLLLRTALLLLISVSLTQCAKEVAAIIAPTQKSTITVYNPTFTTMNITLNGESKTITSGGSAVFTGTPDASASGTASTSGKTTSGTQVGLQMVWSISQLFPSNGSNLDWTLNVDPTYFFLKIINNHPTLSMTQVIVNYGLVSQTIDNVSVPNGGLTYNIGYYRAYSNSNVRTTNGANYWFWNPLSLTFSNNQSITVTGY